jgi:hypothetical protein
MLTRLVAVALALGLAAPDARAGVVLCKHKNGIVVREDACKRKEAQLDPAAFGVMGPGGGPGAPGADGQMRIYGNGSAGARTVPGNQTLADENVQYTDFTVAAGATLTVPSGTVIRCTGTFTNAGVIQVSAGARGAARSWRTEDIDGAYLEAHPGVSSGAAGGGEAGPAPAYFSGGYGGQGLDKTAARLLLHPGSNAGGGGGAAAFDGAAGGGALTVLARGAIVNSGTVHADGAGGASAGSGAGGGGIVILASPSSVTNEGAITAKGGAGGGTNSDNGPGGGGGGGIVNLIAPVVAGEGGIDVDGGAAGIISGPGTVSGLKAGGGGGGACGGNGGYGGSVGNNATYGTAGNGADGHVFRMQVDPTALF